MQPEPDRDCRVDSGPDAGVDRLCLGDLVDAGELQELMDEFHALTGLGMTVLDASGQRLVAVGWQEICTRFHRAHPVTAEKCLESDLELAQHVPPGTFKAYRCKNNMWDIVTPIIIEGVRVGSVFMGQFFFSDEDLDYQSFREQARRYGFPEDEYVAALDKVPRLDSATVNRAMNYFTRLAHLISNMGYNNMRLRELLQQRNRLLQSLAESERRWQFALEGAGDGVWDWDTETDEVFFSRQSQSLLGGPEQGNEIPLEEWMRLVHPGEKARFLAFLNGFLGESNGGQELQCRLRCQDGPYKCVLLRGQARERDAGGRPARVIGTMRDITEQKRAHELLLARENELAAIYENAPAIMMLVDGEGKVRKTNAQPWPGAGVSHRELAGQTVCQVLGCVHGLPEADPAAAEEACPGCELRQAVEEAVRGEREHHELEVQGSFRVRGERRELAFLLTTRFLAVGGETLALASLQDITERKRYEEELKYLTLHDTLTGLYNRAYFQNELQRLDLSREHPVTIISADLDGLKLVNDSLGHQQGDELLQACARVLQDSLRRSDILARVGGDEFAVLLPRTGRVAGEKVVEHIRSRIKEYNLGGESPFPLSVSLGLATAKNRHRPLRDVFREADDLMYRDKLTRGGAIRSRAMRWLVATLGHNGITGDERIRRLRMLSLMLGREAGLSEKELSDLSLLVQVHDLGQAEIPDSIISRVGPLNPEEWQAVKEHPLTGYRLALSTPELEGIAELILKHHERWDGTGYPLGLAGEDIPRPCRVLALTAAFAAMTGERPYRQAMSLAEVRQELERCAGTQFDPRLVQLFLKLLEKE